MLETGGKRMVGTSWLSVSQGIAEDTSDLVSGFATVGDGVSESVDYPNEYWDSDEYDDDEDVGYMRQPIEDEAWFLAHEIDYPSDNEKGTGHGSAPDQQGRGPMKDGDDGQSFTEEDSYFSGEQYFQTKNIQPVAALDDPIGISMSSMYGRTDENDLIAQYDGQLMDEEELNLMRSEPVWQGFVTQSNELTMFGVNGRVLNECERPQPDDICIEDDQQCSVRSIGVGINGDVAEISSEVRESWVGGSSEGDREYVHDLKTSISDSRHSQHDIVNSFSGKPAGDISDKTKPHEDKYIGKTENSNVEASHVDGGFSFPPPTIAGDVVQEDPNKTLWSSKGKLVTSEANEHGNGSMGNDGMLNTWRQKSSDTSPMKSSRDENIADAATSSTPSAISNDCFHEREHVKKDYDGQVGDEIVEDEEAAAVQEQVKQIRAQEEEFETFNLKIVHRKNRHAFSF
ncbi:hypothetical protein ACLOJK_025529 [Asimina triloba]